DFDLDTIVAGFGPATDAGILDDPGDALETIVARQGDPALEPDALLASGHSPEHAPALASVPPVLSGASSAAPLDLNQAPEFDAEGGAKNDRGKGPRPAARKAGGQKEKPPDLAGILDGRGEGARARYAKAGGGTPESERAVDLGLEWLARHQQADGSWSFQHGPDDPGELDCPTGATGLALLCFLGAGNTPKKGPYMSQVNSGIQYLVDHMEVTSSGGWLQGTGLATMYVQGIG